MLYWHYAPELWDLQLVQERLEMLISTTTRHLSQHSKTRQRCLHTELMGPGGAESELHRTFLLLKTLVLSRDFSTCSKKIAQLTSCVSSPSGTPMVPPPPRSPVSRLGREMLDTCSTLLVHCLTVLMSSWMTRSIHLRQGVFSLTICFFTMASNARSGVNSPVLRMHRETDTHTVADRWDS